jgi:aspartate/methionine/tyrosine aminotransferase
LGIADMLADRVNFFTESVIRGTSRHASRFGAINLAQGMPDYKTPQEIKDAACRAIQDGYNQYAVTWGVAELRQAIAAKAARFNQLPWVDADKHVTVTCGATEAMLATLLSIIDPGDEVIVFQPFYENYGPDTLLSGATPVWVKLREPDWSFDYDEVAAAFGPKTKAILINTPNNPTGKVFTREELSFVADLCVKHDVIAVTDEIYEHIILTDQPHVSIASLPGMADRTVTISGLSKTFSVTGWRLGYAIAPEELTNGIRRVHDFLTVGAPHPLQIAGAAALALPDSYYDKIKLDYQHRAAVFLPYLREAGFDFGSPQGAYFVMTDVTPFGAADDVSFVRRLIEEIGVTAVPGSSFYAPKRDGRTKVRFMFAKREGTLRAAGERLLKLRTLKPKGVAFCTP